MLTCAVGLRNHPCPVSVTKNTLKTDLLSDREEPLGALRAIVFSVQIKDDKCHNTAFKCFVRLTVIYDELWLLLIYLQKLQQ